MKILITAPNLDEQQNVSGISTVVRQIIENGGQEFSHFAAGRKDGKKIRPGWVFDQILLLPRFLLKVGREKPQVLHLNTALTPLAIGRDLVLARVANLAKVPVLLHIHGGKFFTQGFSRKFFKRLTEKMLRLSSRVIVLSETEKDFIENHWPDLNVSVLPNAVLPGQIKRSPNENAVKTIIFLGRIDKDKGLKEIIEACRILKDENFRFRFKSYGAGGEKDLFVKKMTEILGDDFYFGGVISGTEKWRVLAESDIFLLPSHYEGLPLALLEAMASGCVAIASDVGSIGEIIEDGKNGFLIKPKDVSQVVKKLKVLLFDKADWAGLRQNARKTIEENFNLRDYIEKLEGIYRKIV
jgi:glycosyltransferase involved in cell wall biosynthesis